MFERIKSLTIGSREVLGVGGEGVGGEGVVEKVWVERVWVERVWVERVWVERVWVEKVWCVCAQTQLYQSFHVPPACKCEHTHSKLTVLLCSS